MDVLAAILTGIVIWIWINPRSFGGWLKKVADGFGPLSLNWHTNVTVDRSESDE